MDESSPPSISETKITSASRAQRPMSRRELGLGRAAVALVFLWAILGMYRVDIVEAIHDGFGSDATEAQGAWGIAQVGATVLFIALMWQLKRRIENADGDGPRYWKWWWIGAAAVLVDLVVFVAIQQAEVDLPLWADLLGAPPVFAGMLVLLIAGLNADPAVLFSHWKRIDKPRDWARAHSVVPIVAGALVWTIAEAIWFPTRIRDGIVKEDFFHEILKLIPVLLIALGVEFKFFRRREDSQMVTHPDPVLRAAPIVTGCLMVIALLLSASTLTYDHNFRWAEWHVYLAFAASVQAAATGLAAVVWLLLSTPPE